MTADRRTARILCHLSVQNRWKIYSLDARTAFMQAKVCELPKVDQRRDRVYLEPPLKGNPLPPHQIFQLDDDRVIYGTREAPQCWANSLGVRLKQSGWKRSIHDLGLWMYFCPTTERLLGAVSLHVDDSFFRGEESALESLKSLNVEWGDTDTDKSKYCEVYYSKDNAKNEITATMEFYLQNII